MPNDSHKKNFEDLLIDAATQVAERDKLDNEDKVPKTEEDSSLAAKNSKLPLLIGSLIGLFVVGGGWVGGSYYYKRYNPHNQIPIVQQQVSKAENKSSSKSLTSNSNIGLTRIVDDHDADKAIIDKIGKDADYAITYVTRYTPDSVNLGLIAGQDFPGQKYANEYLKLEQRMNKHLNTLVNSYSSQTVLIEKVEKAEIACHDAGAQLSQRIFSDFQDRTKKLEYDLTVHNTPLRAPYLEDMARKLESQMQAYHNSHLYTPRYGMSL